MDPDDRLNHLGSGDGFPTGNEYYYLPPTDSGYFSSGNPRSPANPYLSSGIPRPQSGAYYRSGNLSPTSLPYFPSGNPQPPPPNAFVFAEDYYHNRFFNGDYPQLEANSYEPGNSNYNTFLNPLELDFRRLSLSSPLRPPPYTAAAAIRDLQMMRARTPEFYYGRSSITDSTGASTSLYRPPSISERPISDLRGEIVSAAKDHSESRFLMSKFGNPENVRLIFSEVKDHVCELMVDEAGNYFMQKFFAVLKKDQMNLLLWLLINNEGKFKDICTNMHGTRAVQKLLELLTLDQRSLVVSALRGITLSLIKNNNGQRVIQYCIENFHHEDSNHILDVVADNCLDIATDKSGCCFIQQCLTHLVGEHLDCTIGHIISNALILSENQYGNYVVQYMLGFRIPRITFDIMIQLSGNFVSLSLNKYGSNVVEQLLKQSKGDQALPIFNELASNFLRILQDPFGNFVAQRALVVSYNECKAAHYELMKLVNLNYAFLQSHPYGKCVIAFAHAKGFKLVRP